MKKSVVICFMLLTSCSMTFGGDGVAYSELSQLYLQIGQFEMSGKDASALWARVDDIKNLTRTTTAYLDDLEVGRCCYQVYCLNLTLEECNNLAGAWTEGESCDSGPCYTAYRCPHEEDGVTEVAGVRTYRQTVNSASGPDLYFGPWDNLGDCINYQHVMESWGGLGLMSRSTQSYEWFHTFPDWNNPGLTIDSVKLEICALDVDEFCIDDGDPCERDYIRFDAAAQDTSYYLHGENNTFTSSTFLVDAGHLTDDGILEVHIDIDVLSTNCAWEVLVNWSQLKVYSSTTNNPPYNPECTVPACVDITEDMCVQIGPNPADPDGDDVTYEFTWFVDDGSGYVNVLDHPTRDLDHVDGPCVAAADLEVGDIWKVEIYAVDEHGTRSDEPCEAVFPEVIYDCFVPQCPYPQIVHVSFESLPYCECLYICEQVPLTLCVGGDLEEDEMPVEWTIEEGCSPLNGHCEEECDPANPTDDGVWNYNSETKEFCIVLNSDVTGCFCFCLDRILPVELNSFYAVAGDREITLNWSTASELNSNRFEIMRDGLLAGQRDAANSLVGSSYSWTDQFLTNGTEYTYTLIAVDLDGTRNELASVSAIPTFNAAEITEFALHQNYPNPFNPETQIAFDIPEAVTVKLGVYNLLGQQVAELVNGTMATGRHSVTFMANDLPSGMYFYHLEAGEFIAQQKMILMK
ncbi:T9SS type A sorting domain-containing protein [bacterium]|nr:T9SS type A sorting domain-containing protein [bacterium]